MRRRIGYQTNLLILSAGGYKFSDFLRVGIPLTVIMWIGFTLVLPVPLRVSRVPEKNLGQLPIFKIWDSYRFRQ